MLFLEVTVLYLHPLWGVIALTLPHFNQYPWDWKHPLTESYNSGTVQSTADSAFNWNSHKIVLFFISKCVCQLCREPLSDRLSRERIKRSRGTKGREPPTSCLHWRAWMTIAAPLDMKTWSYHTQCCQMEYREDQNSRTGKSSYIMSSTWQLTHHTGLQCFDTVGRKNIWTIKIPFIAIPKRFHNVLSIENMLAKLKQKMVSV